MLVSVFMSFNPNLPMNIDWRSWFFRIISIIQSIQILVITVYYELDFIGQVGRVGAHHPDSFACYIV
jgi:hypothetical protein